MANWQIFELYLIAAPIRFFKRDKIISEFRNPYIEFIWILQKSDYKV